MKSNYNVHFTPQFRVLSDDQMEELHLATLEVLRRTGVVVYEPEGVELLKKAGCKVDGNRVCFPAHLLEYALRCAPPGVTLCDRNGKEAMRLEDGRTYYGTGSDTPNVIDPYSGGRRKGVLRDVEDMARLVDALPNLDFVMSMAIASDVDQAISDLHHFRAMLTNTTKPICFTAWNLANLKDIVEMCEAAAGGAEEYRLNPFAILYAEPTSPLQHTLESTQKLLYMAGKGLPTVYTPAPIAGASAPVTMAGELVQANAELLSGLAMAQLKRAGAPVVYGGGLPFMDMQTMIVPYVPPEFLLSMAAMTDVARYYYRLPVFSYGGCSDSKVFDQQASLEGALWILMTALSGGNLAHDVGYVESGLTASMDMIVMNDEVIGMVRRIMGGVVVDEETMALEVIDEVGPGGHFLDTEHTYRHFRENWFPKLLDRTNYQTWVENGRLTYGQKANARVREILESHTPQPLDEEVKAKLAAIIARAEQRVKENEK